MQKAHVAPLDPLTTPLTNSQAIHNEPREGLRDLPGPCAPDHAARVPLMGAALHQGALGADGVALCGGEGGWALEAAATL